MRWVPQSHRIVTFFNSLDSGVQARQEPEEIADMMTCTPSDCTRRRNSPTRWSVPGPSSTKVGRTGTPAMPPAALICSTSISQALRDGTPNTEAGPDRKVVTPILNSAGFATGWADRVAGSRTVPKPAVSASRRVRDAVIRSSSLRVSDRGSSPGLMRNNGRASHDHASARPPAAG